MPRYSAKVLEYFQDPRNIGVLEDADVVGRSSLSGSAPYTTMYFRIRAGVVEKVTFEAFGCGFMIACCSALTELLDGKPVDECRDINEERLGDFLGGLPPDKQYCAAVSVAAARDAISKLTVQGDGSC